MWLNSHSTELKGRRAGIKADPYADLSYLQRKIFGLLSNTPPSEEGMHVNVICHAVSRMEYTADQIM